MIDQGRKVSPYILFRGVDTSDLDQRLDGSPLLRRYQLERKMIGTEV